MRCDSLLQLDQRALLVGAAKARGAVPEGVGGRGWGASRRQHILVIGSGLIGLTTAYFLQQSGHQVTVIDRRSGPALETSFANGSILTPSMAEPWNAPGCWRVLLKSIGQSDSAMQLRLTALPAMALWGIGFLRNSSAASFHSSTLNNLRLALYSLEIMRMLRGATTIDYGRATRGSLRVFRDAATLERALVAASRLQSERLSFRALSPREGAELEPALAPIAGELAGAIHYDIDETGNAYRFCVGLSEASRGSGVELRFGVNVIAIETRSGAVTGVVCDSERLTADRYVVAAGSYTPSLLKGTGIRVPVRPVKGYSITYPRESNPSSLSTPIVDDDLHAAIVPLEGAIRAAGTAEFAGYDVTLRPERIRNLIGLVRRILPREPFDPAKAKPWCGLRPVSVDGVPFIGPTPIPNLFVNTGHGHLGWTMAAGSGKLLADIMSGQTPSIDPAPYALDRRSTTTLTRLAQ